MDIDSLTKIYTAYCAREGLPRMSADELQLEDVTNEQFEWLGRFIEIWDRLSDRNRPRYLPAPAKRLIQANRLDIDFIHYGEGWFESFLNCWMIPCETYMKDLGPRENGWYHGTMTVEWVESESTYDFSVGDWSPGMNPELHTFER